MSGDSGQARELGLLDAVNAFRREALDAQVWRVVRTGRDPTQGSRSRSRWCNGAFDVLYTSFERDGAIAEIHALLSLQPVFPSRDPWFVTRLTVVAVQTLRLANLAVLARLGVDVARYADRDYRRTQEIADAAYFLDFDGIIAPSARWSCLNAILFTDRIPPDQVQTAEARNTSIDWGAWRTLIRNEARPLPRRPVL